MSTLAEIEAAADALSSAQKQELLLFLTSRLRLEETNAAMDVQYERGYLQLPEEISMTHSLLPHLPVDVENWE